MSLPAVPPAVPPTCLLPKHARVVIVGGGIVGCSTAYHLTQLGVRDVLLLEQGKLTCGTTWHAAGLVGQMRPNRNMTRMSKYGIELYARLEAETGLATGWKQCGSVNVARTPERWQLLKKQAALARSFDVEVQLITPQEAGDLYPIMRTDDLQGAIWIPGDGKANPADLCMSLAKGARIGGARLVEDIEVTGVTSSNGRVTGVRTASGDVSCETLINCAGQWARQFGRLAGVNVPLYPAEHFYIVTDRIEGVHPMLPVMRRPLHIASGADTIECEQRRRIKQRHRAWTQCAARGGLRGRDADRIQRQRRITFQRHHTVHQLQQRATGTTVSQQRNAECLGNRAHRAAISGKSREDCVCNA